MIVQMEGDLEETAASLHGTTTDKIPNGTSSAANGRLAQQHDAPLPGPSISFCSKRAAAHICCRVLSVQLHLECRNWYDLAVGGSRHIWHLQ